MDASSTSKVSEDSRTSMAFFGFEGKASPGRDAPNSDSELLTGSSIVRTGKEQKLAAKLPRSSCSGLYLFVINVHAQLHTLQTFDPHCSHRNRRHPAQSCLE